MSKSNWQIAIEVIGITSIVISLALVTIELKQNQDIQIAQVHTDRANRTIELGRMTYDLRGNEIRAKAADGTELTDHEIGTLNFLTDSYMWHFEDLYFQRQQGLINDETWEAKLSGLEGLVNHPTFKLVYPQLVSMGSLARYDKSFIEMARNLQQ